MAGSRIPFALTSAQGGLSAVRGWGRIFDRDAGLNDWNNSQEINVFLRRDDSLFLESGSQLLTERRKTC